MNELIVIPKETALEVLEREEKAAQELEKSKAKEEAEAAKLAAAAAPEQKKPDPEPEPSEVVSRVPRYAAAPIARQVQPISEKPFLVLMQRYKDLTDEEKEVAPNNGCGAEFASYIRVIHNGETQLLKNDAVEPEDATFSRDFNWVLSAIREAYELGVKDGKQSLKYF